MSIGWNPQKPTHTHTGKFCRVIFSTILSFFLINSVFAESFPNDELMLENKIYDNAAIYDNTGVYSGSVSVSPDYYDATFTCQSGQYLPADSETCTSCPSGYICPGGTFYYDATNNQGANQPKFTLTTTNTTTSFDFSMSAVGTFYVECGDGGTLTSSANPTDISGNTITRSGTTATTYTCTWASAGAHAILFDGTATNYDTDTSIAAMSFYVGANDTASAANSAKIASISGNLSTMFPYISGNAANGAQPRFYQTFRGATNLTSAPGTLFTDYTSGAKNMFRGTFARCTGLTSLPSGLFSTITSGADNMFISTFNGCTGLTSIPENLFFPNAQSVSGVEWMFSNTFEGCNHLTSIPAGLFSKITSGAYKMFYATFRECTNLTSIPYDLFATITTGAGGMFYYTFYGCSGLTSIPGNLFFPNAQSVSGAQEMFYYTFGGCTGLTSLPSGLFSKITSGANNMFDHTFSGCNHLTSIPENLFFPNVQSVPGATHMFAYTFRNCTGLTSLPSGLFSKITSGAENMFQATFAGCTNLGCETTGCSTGTGYIPSDLFAGITPRGENATNTMSNTFQNTKLIETCPSGTTQYTTGWEGSATWNNKVSCTQNVINITWLGATTAAIAANDAGTMIYGGDIRTPQSHDPNAVPIGKHFVGWKFAYDFSTLPTNEYAISSFGKGAYLDTGSIKCVTVTNYNQKNERPSECSYYTEYENLNVGEWMANYSWGTLYGEALCSDTAGSSMGAQGNPESSPGDTQCWCRVTGYTPAGQNKKFPPTSVGWVYNSSTISSGGNTICHGICAGRCGMWQGQYDSYTGFLGSLLQPANQ